MITSPNEMRNQAMDFYVNHFGAEQSYMECHEKLLEGLPQLSQEEKAALDSVDGLSADFYKQFWNTLGPDFLVYF